MCWVIFDDGYICIYKSIGLRVNDRGFYNRSSVQERIACARQLRAAHEPVGSTSDCGNVKVGGVNPPPLDPEA